MTEKSILTMMGVVFFQNKGLEIFTIQNIMINMEIEILLFTPNI